MIFEKLKFEFSSAPWTSPGKEEDAVRRAGSEPLTLSELLYRALVERVEVAS